MSDGDGRGAGGSVTPRSSWYLRVLMTLTATAMGAMMVMTFADVVGRYFLNSPIPGAFEVIGFLLALTIFSALPLVSREEAHITVGLLDGIYRGRVRRVQKFLVLVVSAAMIAFVTERMWAQGEYFREVERLGEYLDVPLWPVVHALTLLGLVTFVVQIGVIWRYLTRNDGPGGAA